MSAKVGEGSILIPFPCPRHPSPLVRLTPRFSRFQAVGKRAASPNRLLSCTHLPQHAHPAPQWLPRQPPDAGPLPSIFPLPPEALLVLRSETVFIRQPHGSWDAREKHKSPAAHGRSGTHRSLRLALPHHRCTVPENRAGGFRSSEPGGLGTAPQPFTSVILFELCGKRCFHTMCLAPA